MFSMWLNTAMAVGQLTVTVAAVCGLAFISSGDSPQQTNVQTLQKDVLEPLYGMTPCSLEGHFLAVSRNGELVEGVAGGYDGLNHVDRCQSISRLAWTPVGSQVAMGKFDGSVHIAPSRHPGLSRELGRMEGSIASITFSPDGNLVIVGTMDGELGVWDLQTGSHRRARVSAEVNSVYVQVVGKDALIAARQGQSRISFWDIELNQTGPVLETGYCHMASHAGASEAPRIVLAGIKGDRREVLLYDTETYTCQWSQLLPRVGDELSSPIHMDISADGRRIVMVSGTSIWSLNPETGEVLKSITENSMAISSVSLAADENSFLTAGYDGSCVHWEISTLEKKWRVQSAVMIPSEPSLSVR
jgi:WD40 repeat protein